MDKSLIFNILGIFTIFVQMSLVLCDGYVELRLYSLENKDHLDHGLGCCDTWPWGVCRGQCDSYFKICVTDWTSSSKPRVSCGLGRKQTGTYDGKSNIQFNGNLGNNIQNPMRFRFDGKLNLFEVMVTSYDEDTWPNPDDLIDIHTQIVYAKHGQSSQNANVQKFDVKGRVSFLKFDVKTYCAQGFTGDDCSNGI
eukprot:TCONS_00008600-protein